LWLPIISSTSSISVTIEFIFVENVVKKGRS
jgi:hypothetical protein